MPLYDYRCAGGHTFERISKGEPVACPCGSEAQRAVVSRFSQSRKTDWGSDFQWTPAMRAAHDEAMGAKKEAESIVREYTENGFKVSQEK